MNVDRTASCRHLSIEVAPTSSGTHDDLRTLTPSTGSGYSNFWPIGSTPEINWWAEILSLGPPHRCALRIRELCFRSDAEKLIHVTAVTARRLESA
jgi:hypothetical protein